MPQRGKLRRNVSKRKRKIDQKKPKGWKRSRSSKSNYEDKETKSQGMPPKTVKIEETVDKHQESSSSEEEINEISSLISTFNNNSYKTATSIESSSDSDEQVAMDSETLLDIKEKLIRCENGNVIETNRISPQECELESTGDETEEAEIDLEIEKQANIENIDDPFVKHLSYDLQESLIQSLQNNSVLFNTHMESWPKIGNLCIQIPKTELEILNDTSSFCIEEKKRYAPESKIPNRIVNTKILQESFIKLQVMTNMNKMDNILSPLQLELFSIINNYQDLYYHQSTFAEQADIRFIYCLHAANHILKTRTKIIHHNAKLSKKEEVTDEFRDQGLIRPKVRKKASVI